MKRRTRRAWTLAVMTLAVVAGKGCAGTNTGNADCVGPDVCDYPTEAASATERWRVLVEYAAGSLRVDGSKVFVDSSGCRATGERIGGQIPLRAAESSATDSGGFSTHFVDPQKGAAWMVDRPTVSTGDGLDFAVASAMDLTLDADGQLDATLTLVRVRFASDGGTVTDDGGTFHIEGPISVACAAGQKFVELPVASGPPVRIGCVDVHIDQPPCHDTRMGGCGF